MTDSRQDGPAAVNVERLLQINIAAMAALGSLLLGMGQEKVLLAAMAAAAAATSVVLTDTLGWFRLNRNLAGVAAVLAVALTLRDFYGRFGTRTELLALANLLTYLQIVLLYQKKNVRIYWQLIVLSLLHIVVSAALYLEVEFGLLLVLYLFVALSALCLLFVHRETARFRAPAARSGANRPPRRQARRRRRWPLSGVAAGLSGRRSDRPAEGLLRWSLLTHVFVMGLATLVVTVVAFFAIPRYRRSAWRGYAAVPPALTGFSTEVRLHDAVNIVESDEPVMCVRFRDPSTGSPYELYEPPYLRGAVLSRYLCLDTRSPGRWKQSPRRIGPWKLPTAPETAGLVRQETVLEPTRDGGRRATFRFLFGVAPSYRDDDTPESIRRLPGTHQLVSAGPARPAAGQQFRYNLLTAGFDHGRQRALVPHEGSDAARIVRENLPMFSAEEKKRLATLIQTADKIVAGIPGENRIGRARAMEAYFLAPGRFTYSLDLDAVPRTPGIDPTEDFVAHHRTGHCEFFASALVLMLRSQDIPARMVKGYAGGDYNPLGDYYQLRAKHAHAWVEAYLEPRHLRPQYVPDDIRLPGRIPERGIWLRLDPTPGGAHVHDREAAEHGVLATSGDLVNYVRLLWKEYVLGLDADRQRRSIYRPVAARMSGLFGKILSRRAWTELFHSAARRLGLDGSTWRGGARPAWPAALAIIVLCLLSAALYRPVRRLTGRLAVRFPRRRRKGRARKTRRVEFYARFEALLARRGMSRRATRTPREFARSVDARLARLPGCRRVAGVPCRIVDAFYRVRFGGHVLDGPEAETIRRELADLEAALNAKPIATDRQSAGKQGSKR